MELRPLIDQYDAFIVDLWGVIHDGSALYPGVTETLTYISEQKKPVVFLSNAPRLAAKSMETLTRLNVARHLYKEVVTSGQVAHDILAAKKEYARYYYLGPGKDEEILAGLSNYEKVSDPAKADFILNTGYEVDFQPHEEILPLLDTLRAHKLPLMCVNPDIEVIKQDGTRQLCAGAVAAEYEKRGGKVHYVGKPYAEVYDVCKNILGKVNMLVVGDNPDTDIEGARRMGFDSLLISGGILAGRGERAVKSDATYMLPSFRF